MHIMPNDKAVLKVDLKEEHITLARKGDVVTIGRITPDGIAEVKELERNGMAFGAHVDLLEPLFPSIVKFPSLTEPYGEIIFVDFVTKKVLHRRRA